MFYSVTEGVEKEEEKEGILTHQTLGSVSPQRRSPGQISSQSLDSECYRLLLSCRTTIT